MYGETANKLILDGKRSSNLSSVPLYQSELVRDIVREINDLDKDVEFLQEQQQDDDKVNQCQLFVTHLSMRRNKRCLLAYEKLRADKISEFTWLGIDPSESMNDKNIPNYTTNLDLNNLNHFEQDFYKQYQDLITDYKTKFTDIDFSGDLDPPTNIFIDVRVLKDGGEVTTEYGSFNLIKDSQFFVRKSDVERLIQQGYLEELCN